MGSNMSDQKNTEEESVLGEIKENMEEKAANVKEKVNEGVDEVKKRTSNVIKAAQGIKDVAMHMLFMPRLATLQLSSRMPLSGWTTAGGGELWTTTANWTGAL